mmetsp:Transcript_13706/g.27649  ORF Transcript_13706/g.27649 Transcript_13706/m.27649 type:complete len:85 (+) Transcript_13706:631-885(+)
MWDQAGSQKESWMLKLPTVFFKSVLPRTQLEIEAPHLRDVVGCRRLAVCPLLIAKADEFDGGRRAIAVEADRRKGTIDIYLAEA